MKLIPNVIAICVCAAACTRAAGELSPRKTLDTIIEYERNTLPYEGVAELRLMVSRNPEVYAPLLARHLTIPQVGQRFKLPERNAIGVIHLLGVKHGMPLAVELHVAATRACYELSPILCSRA